jgi:hypothetical protein
MLVGLAGKCAASSTAFNADNYKSCVITQVSG